MNRTEEEEQSNPLHPWSVCRAVHTFEGVYKQDLPFREGDIITIIEPCNRLFWYYAKDEKGNKGVVPVTHIEVLDSVRARPPTPPRTHPSVPFGHPSVPVGHPGGPFGTPGGPFGTPGGPFGTPGGPFGTPGGPLGPPSGPVGHPSVPVGHQSVPVGPPSGPFSHPSGPFGPPGGPFGPPGGPFSHPFMPPFAHPPHVTPPTDDDNDPSDGSLGERPPHPIPPNRPKPITSVRTDHHPLPKYKDMATFLTKSGWYNPNIDDVLMSKTTFTNIDSLQKLKIGVYIFIHKTVPGLRFVGKSSDLYHELHRLFDTLYAKPVDQLNPIEIQLRFHHPDASEWHLRVYRCRMDDLETQMDAKILEYETLRPKGLNEELSFSGKQSWEKFCSWYLTWKKNKERSLAAS